MNNTPSFSTSKQRFKRDLSYIKKQFMSRYTCENCSKGYNIYASYASHRRKHRAPTVGCDNCGTLFNTHAALYKHAYQSGCKKTVPVVETIARTPIPAPRPLSLMSGFLDSGGGLEYGGFDVNADN
jgi:hypothetical protein